MPPSQHRVCTVTGRAIEVAFHDQCYVREALTAAAYCLTDRYTVTIDHPDGQYWVVRIAAHNHDAAPDAEVADMFCRSALDYQVRHDLDVRTGDLRKIIVEHAFAPAHAREPQKKNPEQRYTLLPFTFRRLNEQDVLLVNQAGEYTTIPASEFQTLLNGTLDIERTIGYELESRQLIARGDADLAIDLLATKLRTRKAYLRDFTALHMVVLTRGCNCQCIYCQASSAAPEAAGIHMSRATADRVVNMIFQTPSPVVKIEFQGGEPTLNWDVLTHIVEYAETLNGRQARKRLEFVVCTNLTHVTDAMLRFFRDHRIAVSTSLDGPKDVHDYHRPCRNGRSSYDALLDGIERARAIIGPAACSPLVTITRQNLHRLRDVVDEYRRLGFTGLFLRPVNPYGTARESWENLACSVDEFVQAYTDILDYILSLNRAGERFVEFYTTLLLTRMLTPFSTGFMDLQSPAGAGISGVIYDYDGNVYPTDEGRMLARMGDLSFCLGSVHRQTYEDIFLGGKLRDLIEKSCVETMPACANCVYQFYCGADPIRYYVECGDPVGHRPTSEFCRKNQAIFDYLIPIVLRNDPAVMDVFWSWITDRGVAEIYE